MTNHHPGYLLIHTVINLTHIQVRTYKLAIIRRLIAASDRSRIYINSNNSDVINVTFQIRSNYYRTCNI